MAAEYNISFATNNLGHIYKRQNKFDLAIKYYMKAAPNYVKAISDIMNIISKVSNELQLEVLELVPAIRFDDIYFHKISYAAGTLFMNKKMEMTKCLSVYLIDDLVRICVDYY